MDTEEVTMAGWKNDGPCYVATKQLAKGCLQKPERQKMASKCGDLMKAVSKQKLRV